jgi:hypothetical protein
MEEAAACGYDSIHTRYQIEGDMLSQIGGVTGEPEVPLYFTFHLSFFREIERFIQIHN